jgi:hypothetical protein
MPKLNKYITLLEKLTNKKVKLIENDENGDNNILIPRRSPEERQKNYIIATNKKIQEYIKNGSKGNLDLSESPIEILPDDLIEVGGSLYLFNCKNLKSLNNLKYVNGNLYLSYCKNLIELPDSLKVGDSLYLSNTSIKELPNNLEIGRNLSLNNTLIEKLPDDLKVGRLISFHNTPLSKNEELLNQYKKKFNIII